MTGQPAKKELPACPLETNSHPHRGQVESIDPAGSAARQKAVQRTEALRRQAFLKKCSRPPSCGTWSKMAF